MDIISGHISTLASAAEARASLRLDVTRTFGRGQTEIRALDCVSVAIMPGTFTAVMGPSGCDRRPLSADASRNLADIRATTEAPVEHARLCGRFGLPHEDWSTARGFRKLGNGSHPPRCGLQWPECTPESRQPVFLHRLYVLMSPIGAFGAPMVLAVGGGRHADQGCRRGSRPGGADSAAGRRALGGVCSGSVSGLLRSSSSACMRGGVSEPRPGVVALETVQCGDQVRVTGQLVLEGIAGPLEDDLSALRVWIQASSVASIRQSRLP